MKISIKFLIITIFAILGCSREPKSNIGQTESKIPWINFNWVGDSLSGRYFDKLAINVPFRIDGIPNQFTSQFDLGATSIMVYGNTFKPYLTLYPEINNKLDSINKNHQLQSQANGKFVDVTFYLDSVPFSGHEIAFFENFGENLSVDSARISTNQHIGTIGAYICRDKFLLIDYPRQQLAILDTLPQFIYQHTSFVDCRVDNGRIKVPFSIGDTIQYLMYDTGASLFPIMTDEEHWHKIGDMLGEKDTINISTWGEYYDVYGTSINAPISVGNYKLKTARVYMNPRKDFEEFFQQEQIMGITGNAYFLNETVVFDFKNKKFGILKQN